MKTQVVKTSVKKSNILEFVLYALVVAAALMLTSCSSDDEAEAPDTRPMFLGTFAVEDVSASGNTYNYDITIANGSNGDLNISNFADLFNVPVKATADGSKLTIKSQSFTNPSGKQIQVSGSGVITGDVLNFTYTTTGYLNYTGTCKANKQQPQ
jgi:hypothetical protein